MSEGLAVKERRRTTGPCQHRWVIEPPNGATSRGRCKRCGASRRFPNAPEDALWDVAGGTGRFSRRFGVARPAELRYRDEPDEIA